jgi:hypothetical protein
VVGQPHMDDKERTAEVRVRLGIGFGGPNQRNEPDLRVLSGARSPDSRRTDALVCTGSLHSNRRTPQATNQADWRV